MGSRGAEFLGVYNIVPGTEDSYNEKQSQEESPCPPACGEGSSLGSPVVMGKAVLQPVSLEKVP